MGIFYVATIILLILSPSARAFMAFGVQEVTDMFALERQRLSTGSQQGFVALREAPGIEVQKSRDIRPRRDGACRLLSRRSTRTMRNVCRHQNVAPLMALDPDTVYSANEWIAGVAGGSVGVLGTLIQLELKQERLRSRRNCPFCNGSGQLVCASCCGSGTFSKKLAASETYSTLPCASCSGKRYITCLNCRGDGRAVPREFDRKMTDAVEVDLKLEEIGMGSVGQ